MFTVEGSIIVGVEAFMSWYQQHLRTETEAVAKSLRNSLTVSGSLVLSDDFLQAAFLKQFGAQTAKRRAWCEWSPVVLALACTVLSVVNYEAASEVSYFAQPACWTALLLGIKLLPIAVHDMGMWWRLNFFRHLGLSVMSLTIELILDTKSRDPIMQAPDSAIFPRLLKSGVIGFFVNTWLEVGGWLQLPCWLWVNTCALVQTLWVEGPKSTSNAFMEQLVPFFIGSTLAMLWVSSRHAWALQRFLRAQR